VVNGNTALGDMGEALDRRNDQKKKRADDMELSQLMYYLKECAEERPRVKREYN
jgi:hypothetical protein